MKLIGLLQASFAFPPQKQSSIVYRNGVGWTTETGRAFRATTNGDRGNAYRILAGKPEGTEPLETMMS
jgi:hypothetical protein